MGHFIEAYERFGRAEMEPDFYILLGYMIALTGVEAFGRALEAGDVSRDGLMAALHTIEDWDVAGLFNPITVTLTSAPYEGAREVRLRTPLLSEGSWKVVSDYAAPLSDAGGG